MEIEDLRASAALVIPAPAEALYAFIADMPRVGEVSPVCTGGEWESDARGVGATFIGTNTMGDMTWQARMRVETADAPHVFAWDNVGDPAVPVNDDTVANARWTYRFTPVEGGTEVVASWEVLPESQILTAVDPQIVARLPKMNAAGMEQTLANIKTLFES
jgi:hypothetical protein